MGEILCDVCVAREQQGQVARLACPDCNLARLSAAVVEAAVDLRVAVAAYDDALEQGLMPDDVRHRRAVAWAARESLNRCTDALIAARKEASRG